MFFATGGDVSTLAARADANPVLGDDAPCCVQIVPVAPLAFSSQISGGEIGTGLAASQFASASRWRIVSRYLPVGVAPEQGLQVKTVLTARSISAAFPEIREIGGVRPDALRWHPNGLALDVMVPNPGTAEGIALGNEIVAFVLKNATRFGMQDVIWRGATTRPTARGQPGPATTTTSTSRPWAAGIPPARNSTSAEPACGDRYARRVLLSDRDLRAEISSGRLGIDPFDDTLVQPSSIDVRLDCLFRVFNNTRYTHIDPAKQQDELTSLVQPVDGEPFVLHPGEFVLGSTLELFTLPDNLAGRLEGKSSLGRLGLLTHSTAGFIDPGFSGHITLELSNVANLPITLWPGMKIGQLCMLRLTSPSEHPYGSSRAGSKYQGQRGPTPSRSYQNFIRST